jgi:hypothetical protein
MVPQLVLARLWVKVEDMCLLKALLAVAVVQNRALAPNNLNTIQLACVHQLTRLGAAAWRALARCCCCCRCG